MEEEVFTLGRALVGQEMEEEGEDVVAESDLVCLQRWSQERVYYV